MSVVNILYKLVIFIVIFTKYIKCSGCERHDVLKDPLPPPCDSFIYCHGPLLHTVQMSSIFRDSKTFVDMKMRHSPNETLAAFQQMMNDTNERPSKNRIRNFVHLNFEEPGKEFEKWNLSDWVEKPEFLERITDNDYRKWASELNALWNFLGRKMVSDVKQNPEQYSIIYVPNPVIVPGGRFREFYYWDSYWIIRGLLLSEMYDTARGMLANFLTIVDKFGFIPNGGRVYYARRSQPPLLIPMVDAYLEVTQDKSFLIESLPTLEAEFQFWMNNHTAEVVFDGKKYKLFTYGDCSSGPRPESYREDIHTAQVFPTESEKDDFYAELKAAAESGWDFSSRWFILNGINAGNLTNLHTRSIVPVDLNAIMYWNADLLSKYMLLIKNETASQHYRQIAEQIKDAVMAVLWDDQEGSWFDYDLINDKKRNYFYPTNIAPLWTGCYDKSAGLVDKVIQYLKKANDKLLSLSQSVTQNHLGGIPTTMNQTGEQWDYPNVWPPLQYIMVMALNNTDNAYAKELAYQIGDRWVRTNFVAYNETKAMYEKYDSRKIGGHGGGGEYEVQLGFGWTNGVILELLDRYGWRMNAIDHFDDALPKTPTTNISVKHATAGGSEARTFITAMLVITISVAAGLIGITVCRMWAVQSEYRQKLNIGRPRTQYKELRSLLNDRERKPTR